MDHENEGNPARITAVHRGRYEAVCDEGIVQAALKSGAYYGLEEAEFPSVGDFVQLQYNPCGNSLVLRTLERKSKFSRSDFSGHGVNYVKTVLEQVVAANFDYVFIMASLNYDFKIKRIERYLVSAWQSGGTPVLVLTKADLVEDYSGQVAAVEQIAMGADIIPVSAKEGAGLDRLAAYLAPGKTAVFLGSSGVGKSSLVNALAGEDIMRVNDIRLDDSKGRHTTTHRQLVMLPSGGMIIDTPGMRELGMWDTDDGITGAFADVEELMTRCKYSDCAHITEPGCAVKAALESGELPGERWENYLELKRETKFVEDKSTYLRQKDKNHKSISKMIRAQQKGGK